MQTPLTQMMLSVMGLELLPISNVLYMYIVRALWKLSKYHSDAQNKIRLTLSSIWKRDPNPTLLNRRSQKYLFRLGILLQIELKVK